MGKMGKKELSSHVWKEFDSDPEGDPQRKRCKTCNSRVKFYANSTSTLIRHMKKYHHFGKDTDDCNVVNNHNDGATYIKSNQLHNKDQSQVRSIESMESIINDINKLVEEHEDNLNNDFKRDLKLNLLKLSKISNRIADQTVLMASNLIEAQAKIGSITQFAVNVRNCCLDQEMLESSFNSNDSFASDKRSGASSSSKSEMSKKINQIGLAKKTSAWFESETSNDSGK